MKIKDLKINFRYLGGNIACLSVDSISGESVHNDINNEEAIIIFNSLVGEKADCQTVKSLLKENQELKKKYENAVVDYETTMAEKNELKSQLKGTTHCFDEKEHKRLSEQLELLTSKLDEYDLIVDERNQLKNQLEEYKDKINWYENFEVNKTIDKLRLKHNIQQKEFIKYLEDLIKRINPKDLDIGELNLRLDDIKFTQYLIYKEILQKCKETIGEK